MATLYGHEHRALQDAHDTRRLADLWSRTLIHDALTPEEAGFIASRDMFFLSTVDGEGRPTVSYKGGPAGFVRVLDPTTLAFPGYDGNGMFLSAGNIATSGLVGLLFIDFETPHRLRVQGGAELVREGPLVEGFVGADHAVRVRITDAFVNCARYIHRYRRIDQSRHTPQAGAAQPYPAWKRIDLVQDDLPAQDAGRTDAEGGPITLDAYVAKVAARES